MREDNSLQTPLRNQTPVNRRSKPISDHNKKNQKLSRKSLNPVFTAVAEESSQVTESHKDTIDFSFISDVSDENLLIQFDDNFISPVNPVATPCPQTAALYDIPSPSSSVITYDQQSAANAPMKQRAKSAFRPENLTGSLETDFVIHHLKEARTQLIRSNTEEQSKNILDALVNVVTEAYCGRVSEEKDWFDEFVSSRRSVALLSFMLWGLTVFICFSVISEGKHQFGGPPPT